MELSEVRTLIRFSRRRFRNFSNAADELLKALAEALPGVVILAQRDPDESILRVIEARGQGVSGLDAGTSLPVAGNEVDGDFLHSLGGQAWLNAPLEMSDGRIVGVLCAVDAGAGAYRPEHAVQLSVAARLLSHEWESVELRSELRRLRGQVSAGPGTDPDTGLPNRSSFLDLLTREWRLTERGTVQSVLVICQVATGTDESEGEATGAEDRLAVKLAAETLAATARRTDCVGRTGEMAVGAILVGCDPESVPDFLARFLGAFERVVEGRGDEIEVMCGAQPLAGTASPEEALDLAEVAAENPDQARTPELTPGAAE
jgi:GGDEF domain-containing protein